MSSVTMSPLFNQDVSSDGLAVSVKELSGLAMIDLRIEPDNQPAIDRLAYALGMPLPTKPRTTTHNGGVTCIWMSVDHWLIVAPLEKREGLLMGMRTTLEDVHGAVTDVTDARGILRISGNKARQVLMKSISNDVYGEEVVPGFARRATLGEIATVIHFVTNDPEETFDIFMFRSYAPYALDWISTVANEKAVLDSFFEKAEAPIV